MTAVDRAEKRRTRHHGGLVALSWAGMLAVLAGVMYGFGGPTMIIRGPLDFWEVLIILFFAGVVAFWAGRPPRPKKAKVTGAPSMALAFAFLLCAIGWVFGLYMAYFAIPLLAFCISRWRAEWKGGPPPA